MAEGTFDFLTFIDEIAALSLRRLSGVSDLSTLCDITEDLVDFAERRLTEALPPHERSLIACSAGCGFCCRVQVDVLLPEAATIVRFLGKCPPGDGTSGLTRRLSELYEMVRWMDDGERRWKGIPCPFLAKDQSCEIYPVRPLACRGITSTNPSDCRAVVGISPAIDEAPLVLQNLTQRVLMQAAFVGISQALTQAGLDSRSFELTGMVLTLFRQPERGVEFMAGKRVLLI